MDGNRPGWSDLDSDSNFMLYSNYALNREKHSTVQFVYNQYQGIQWVIRANVLYHKKEVRYQNNTSNETDDEAWIKPKL